jgi:hypothetical protein
MLCRGWAERPAQHGVVENTMFESVRRIRRGMCARYCGQGDEPVTRGGWGRQDSGLGGPPGAARGKTMWRIVTDTNANKVYMTLLL